MGPIGGVVKLIGSGIGLANEAYAHNKQQRQLKKEGKGKEAAVEAREVDDFLSPQPSNEQRRPSSTANSTHGSDDDSDDDELWQLDEAAEAADRKQHPSAYNTPAQTPSLENPPAYTVEELVDDFIEHHPELPPSYSPAVGKLSAPVILPQKRPRNKGRGFVRAYAPALEECGIDQATFLDFLDTFDKSTKASQYLQVINAAAGIVGIVPEPIIMAVTISVQVAVGTAMAVQTLRRTNSYLDKMNEKLFRPHGLYCMLMTFKPAVRGDTEPVLTAGLIEKSTRPLDSKIKEQVRMLRKTSGTAKGELELPEPAPLVFPALEEAMKKDENAFKSTSKFMADYYDRRAAAKYAYQNPDSKLNVPQQKQFASRYSDPNHPANSGSLSALLTGGKFDLTKGKRERKIARRDRRQQRRGYAPMTEEQKRQPRKGLITKFLTQDVLYMIIVNMPSEAEMEKAIRIAEATGERK